MDSKIDVDEAPVHAVVLRHRDQCVNEFGDSKCWTILASGPDDNLQAWAFACWPDFFDRRKQTCRCRLWVMPDEPEEAAVIRAVGAAKIHDVTIQLLCCGDPIEESAETHDIGGGASVTVRDIEETYPVIYCGSHGMKW